MEQVSMQRGPQCWHHLRDEARCNDPAAFAV